MAKTKADSEEKAARLSPEEAAKHLDFIKRQKNSHPVVKAHHGKWKELIAWKNGDQFSEWKEEARTLRPVELRLRKKRVVINLMKPLGEAIEGKLNFAYQLAGMPNSGERGDIAAAGVATKLLAHNDRVNEIESKMEEMKGDLIDTGNACMVWTFEKDYYADLVTGVENGKPIGERRKAGEVACHVPSIFNVRPDSTARSRSDMRWFIEFAEVERSRILAAFPEITEEDLDRPLEGSSEDAAPDKYSGMNESQDDKDPDEKTDIVAWFWEKSGDKHPAGRLIISTERAILHEGKSPSLGEIPAFFFRFKKNGNSFWGTGPFHHVQSIQREFNRIVSIISEHIEGWRAKLALPDGSVTRQGALTMDNFEIVEYDPTKGPPHAINMPELSPQVMIWKDFLMGALNQVANVHEVSYSQLPKYASRAPASLFSMMLEQENLKIDPLIKYINRTIREMGSFRLKLMDKYYTGERLIKVIGRNNQSTIYSFKGADLSGNFDVVLEIGVSMKQSRIIQQRLLLELRQMGIITDNNKILKLLGEGDIEEGLMESFVDEQRARRENQAFISDDWAKPRDKGGVFLYAHDDDLVHLSEHTDLSKSEEAQAWPTERWNALQTHILDHMKKYQIAQMQSAAMAQAQQPGQPAPAPGAQSMAEGAQAEPEVVEEREDITM